MKLPRASLKAFSPGLLDQSKPYTGHGALYSYISFLSKPFATSGRALVVLPFMSGGKGVNGGEVGR